MICKICKEQKIRNDSKIKRGINVRQGNYFIDENGNKWNGHECPKCKNDMQMASNRRNGKNRSIDDQTDPTLKKGRDSERIVEAYFSKWGFKTTLTKRSDIDLIIEDSWGSRFTIEVKTASERRGRTDQWRVGSLGKSGFKSEYIAIVLPKGNFIIETMKNHLKFCSKDGGRNVSEMVLKYS